MPLIATGDGGFVVGLTNVTWPLVEPAAIGVKVPKIAIDVLAGTVIGNTRPLAPNMLAVVAYVLRTASTDVVFASDITWFAVEFTATSPKVAVGGEMVNPPEGAVVAVPVNVAAAGGMVGSLLVKVNCAVKVPPVDGLNVTGTRTAGSPGATVKGYVNVAGKKGTVTGETFAADTYRSDPPSLLT